MYNQPKPSFVRMTPRGEYRLADMYQAPPAYGAPPEGLEWDPEGQQLALRWAEDGGPTKDLWLWSAEGGLRRLASASDFPPHPREDDDRSDKEREHAERMNPGVAAATWSKRGGSLYFLCRGDLYRIDGDGERRTLIHGSGDVSGLTAIPDSDDVSFMWKGSLWRTQGEGLRRLTYVTKTDHDVIRHEWSRDGDRVAVVVQDKSSWDRVKMPDYTPEDEVKINELRRNNVGGPLAKMRVATVGAEGGLLETVAIEQAGDGPVDQGSGEQFVLHDLCWTSGGGLLIAYVGPWYRDFSLALHRPGDDDRPRVIYRETAEPWFPHSRIGVGADPEAAYLTSPRDGWLRLYRVPLDGSPLEAVSRPGCDVARFEVPPEGEGVVYTAFTPDPRDQSLIRVRPNGDDETVLIEGAGSCDFRASDDGSAVAAQVSAVMEPPKLLAVSPDGERTEILRTETERFADVPKPRVDRFEMPFSFSKRPEDESLLGKLILPPDFDPDRQYPVVLSCVYAGQGKSGYGRYQLLDSFMAAEMGYIAVGLDLRASMGYGHQFLTGYYKSLGIIDAEECVRCAEHLSGLPYVDGERIGIWGGSYGGFLVLMAMCNHPGVFHTGVSWKPVTDWRNYWDSYTAPRLTRPDDDPEVFKATSPVFHAEGLEGNLLLVHGMQDDNVLFQDAVWMIQELVEAGKYFDLMIYPKDDHGLTKREESLPDLMERIAAYFEEHMGLGPIE